MRKIIMLIAFIFSVSHLTVRAQNVCFTRQGVVWKTKVPASFKTHRENRFVIVACWPGPSKIEEMVKPGYKSLG